MAYFPFFVEIEGKNCLIVGGGPVGYRKASQLLDYGPCITVVAKSVIPAFDGLKGIRIIRREFEAEDLDGIDFAVVCTGNEAVNRMAARLCREKRIPVNAADLKEDCSFLFPSLIRDRAVTVGITTSGKSPAMAAFLKREIERALPKFSGRLAEKLGEYREYIKMRTDSAAVRAAVFERLVKLGMKHDGNLTDEMVELTLDAEDK